MNNNHQGAPPPMPEPRIECPWLFVALEIVGLVIVAGCFYLAWIVL